jgi:hypothetical protein
VTRLRDLRFLAIQEASSTPASSALRAQAWR